MTDSTEWRRDMRQELMGVADRLTAEYAGQVAPGSVHRLVYRSREQLLFAGLREGIIPATESTVRLRLRQVVGSSAAP